MVIVCQSQVEGLTMQDVVDHMDIGSCNKGIKYLSASSRLLRYIFLIDNVCDVYFGIQPCELYIYIYVPYSSGRSLFVRY